MPISPTFSGAKLSNNWVAKSTIKVVTIVSCQRSGLSKYDSQGTPKERGQAKPMMLSLEYVQKSPFVEWRCNFSYAQFSDILAAELFDGGTPLKPGVGLCRGMHSKVVEKAGMRAGT